MISSIDSLKIWKYWQCADGTSMPWHIEKLLRQPEKYSTHKLIVLDEKSILKYAPLAVDEIKKAKAPIKHIAHKADIFRAAVLHAYGGLWLDCDSIIVNNIDCIFDDLKTNDMVTFTESGQITQNKSDPTLIQCLACRPGCYQIGKWNNTQYERLKISKNLKWLEIGAESLNSICLKHPEKIKVRPALQIEPIKWNEHAIFNEEKQPEEFIKPDTLMFMYFNHVSKIEQYKEKSLFNQLVNRYA